MGTEGDMSKKLDKSEPLMKIRRRSMQLVSGLFFALFVFSPPVLSIIEILAKRYWLPLLPIYLFVMWMLIILASFAFAQTSHTSSSSFDEKL